MYSDAHSSQMAVYRFEHMQVRSIGLERRNNYLIVITRVARSPDQFEPASSRSEKRIVGEFAGIIVVLYS